MCGEMAAAKGNDYHLALREPGLRQRAYKDFCRHLADGYPIESWSYREGDNGCIWRTMLNYIKKNPEEFQTFLKDEAHCLSYKKWFEKGINLTDGKVKGNPSPQTWATIMRNMFRWDKERPEDDADTSKMQTIIDFMQKISLPKPLESVPRESSNHSE